MTQFFRSEATQAQRDQWLGSIVLVRPVSFKFLVAMAAACAAVVVLFLVFGHYTKRANVAGVLVPDKGIIRVMPPAQAVVAERHVREGQFVHAGDVLFVLNADRQFAAVGSAGLLGNGSSLNASAAIQGTLRARKQSLVDEQASQATLAQQQRNQLDARVRALQAESENVERQVQTQRRRVASTEAQLARVQGLVRQKFFAEGALTQKQDELLEQQARLQGLEQALLQSQREVASARSELDQLGAKVQREAQQLARALSEIEEAEISAGSQRRLVVTAPSDGTVAAVMAEPGMSVGASPLLTLLPAGAVLEAQLFAPSAAAGFVQQGQQVRLRYAAYPHQKFGQYEGQVLSVSRSALSAQDLPQSVFGAAGQSEGLYRIRVALRSQNVSLYGKQQPLSAGMQVEADVLQDTRSLIEWVFEPVFSLKGQL